MIKRLKGLKGGRVKVNWQPLWFRLKGVGVKVNWQPLWFMG
jgi:hypothetical protein